MKKGWEYKTLGEIATFSRGLTYKKGDEVSMSKNVVLRSNNIDLMSGQLDLSELKYLNEDFNIPKDKKVIKDSLLICMSNGSKNHLGKVALIDVDYGYAFGGFMGLIVPVQCIKGKYLHIVMSSPKYKEYIKTLSAGANINNLKFADLSKFVIPVPPLSEQEEIVSRLDKAFEQIETMRRNAEQSLTTAQQLFQSTLSHLLTPQPHWERKTLKDIGKTQTGSTPPMSHKEYYGDYIPFIKPSEINHDGIGGINYATLCLSKLGAKHGRVFEIGSIFMVCIGATISKTGISNQVISCNQQINVVTPFKGYSNKYIYYSLCNPNFKSKVIKEGTSAQATLPIISKGKWETLTIDIPPHTEQTAIVAKLDSLSAKVKQLKDNYTRTVVLCDEMKQALLKEVFED